MSQNATPNAAQNQPEAPATVRPFALERRRLVSRMPALGGDYSTPRPRGITAAEREARILKPSRRWLTLVEVG